MKMRQHKRNIYAKMFSPVVWGQSAIGRVGTVAHPYTVEIFDNIGNDTMSLGELFREAAGIEAAKVEFVCVKVSDGSVVDTFDTREGAEELVDKHARGKKAKLEILETGPM